MTTAAILKAYFNSDKAPTPKDFLTEVKFMTPTERLELAHLAAIEMDVTHEIGPVAR